MLPRPGGFGAWVIKTGGETVETMVTYFEKHGPQNTETVLRLAGERARERGIGSVVVASSHGDTAVQAVTEFKGLKVVAVGLVYGARQHTEVAADSQLFTPENEKIVTGKGGIVLHGTHAFGGLNYAVQNRFNLAGPAAIIGATLRVVGGRGLKVACEISMMAADHGLISTVEDAIAIAGSGRGADTAVVLRPVITRNFFDLKVKEIICKPLT